MKYRVLLLTNERANVDGLQAAAWYPVIHEENDVSA